jgi:dTDP-4-dehydrorhamnose reductase
MRILIFGKAGQVARELASIRWPDAVRVWQFGRAECDLMQPGAASSAIGAARPDVVINAAAYTAVDRAEAEPGAAARLNAGAVAEMAQAIAAQGGLFLHLSTDYVFDGQSPGAYREDAPCNPLSVYGETKRSGELAIAASGARHVILRTSWVFSPHGGNFVRTMLRLGAERDTINVVGDQMGGPTAAADIAQTLRGLALTPAPDPAGFGIFHYSGAPVVSWHGFATAIFEVAAKRGMPVPRLTEITTEQFKTAARRPANSALDCSLIEQIWQISRPDWRQGLVQCIDDLAANPRKSEGS